LSRKFLNSFSSFAQDKIFAKLIAAFFLE